MMLSAAVLLATLAPQQNPSLRLPEQPRQAAPAPAERPLNEVDRFRRELSQLRGVPEEVERVLQRIAQDYPDVEALILQRLVAALPREMLELSVAARRFASPRIADEVLFQLLARPIGDSTREMLETMVYLKGTAGKEALRDCVRGRIAGVRRVATEILARMATVEDLEFALLLADEQSLDLQLSGVHLLAAIPDDRAKARLCRLLAREPTVAGAACSGLLQLGAQAVPALQRVLAEPPIDRSFAYAAFALAALDRDGTTLPPPAAAAPLQRNLGGTDTLARGLSSVALAAMCYHAQAPGVHDVEVVDALLDLVAPAAFVPNFEMLRRPAELALQRLSGRSGNENVVWRGWWTDARQNFAGLRARIDVSADAAGSAVLTLRDDRRQMRILGEDLADLPVQGSGLEFVLERAAMQKLVAELEAAGFMRPGAVQAPAGLPIARQLELVVRSARAQVGAPAQPLPAFDGLAAILARVAEAEVWQLLRHPVDEPERGAYWRAERRARQEQTDPLELDRRGVRRAVKVLPVAGPAQKARILAWLLALPDRRDRVGEAEGDSLLAIVRKAQEFGETEMLLLELAAAAPGDRVWRDCVDLAARAPVKGRSAVDRVFTVLGADRVLAALDDERAPVRRAAIDEVVQTRDMRAGERLVAMFDDKELEVRRAAVYAAGQLQLGAARQPLVHRIAAEATEPQLRRDALVALGRIGGEGTFTVLQRALAAPAAADRDAALRGIGELRDPRAAVQLAAIFGASIGTPTAELARSYLLRLGSGLAVPALRQQLAVQNDAVRSEIVMMLGAWQDPQVVPELIELFQRRREPLVVGGMLAGTTGLDLESVSDPMLALSNWYRDHRLEPQWRWLLQALQRDSVASSLDEAQFATGAGFAPVPELARLMVEAEAGRLRVLAAAVLRTQTGEDYGQVTPSTPVEVRETVAARYRELYESARAAQGR